MNGLVNIGPDQATEEGHTCSTYCTFLAVQEVPLYGHFLNVLLYLLGYAAILVRLHLRTVPLTYAVPRSDTSIVEFKTFLI
ncbi:hypothetical protein DPMN_054760 [Dreissena polymorpha]|uniref:Uncharacterized protein n=1 Tax=Dreissena polymorpha TaxID=45954 RepID=A0A9D4CR01_DREPO|nr:hypothetical protein DPMN_054760 [Dreissena polymorpha]